MLVSAPWADGRITAGTQSAQAKHNLQLPEDCETTRITGRIVLAALERNALFFTAALPRQIFPPLFNRYEGGMSFGNHVDNAVRRIASSGARVAANQWRRLMKYPCA
jgi:PKHD-type hydroxylase